MTTAAKTAFGAELWLAPTGQPLVKVAELLTLNPPKITRETIDATTHDSPAGAQEIIAEGTYKPGNITAQVNYVMGSLSDLALLAAAVGGLQDFRIVAKAAVGTDDMTGSGYVIDYGVDDLPTRGKQTASFGIEVSGPVIQ